MDQRPVDLSKSVGIARVKDVLTIPPNERGGMLYVNRVELPWPLEACVNATGAAATSAEVARSFRRLIMSSPGKLSVTVAGCVLAGKLPEHRPPQNRGCPRVNLVVEARGLACGIEAGHWSAVGVDYLRVPVGLDAAVREADAGDDGIGHERVLVDPARPIRFHRCEAGRRQTIRLECDEFPLPTCGVVEIDSALQAFRRDAARLG